MTTSILVADDNPAVRTLLVRLIRRASPRTEIVDVGSAKAALAACARRVPDIVVLDHGLPDTSGFCVLQYLKMQSAPPYVIVITGDPRLEQDARARGADDVWLKPMDVTVMLQHFTQLLPCG